LLVILYPVSLLLIPNKHPMIQNENHNTKLKLHSNHKLHAATAVAIAFAPWTYPIIQQV